MKNEKYMLFVREKLDDRTVLEGFAEEQAEWTQATLKLIRALNMNSNVTPISGKKAFE